MAREFFKDLPNTTTPLNASRLNGLLDGEEAMGNLVVDSVKSKNILDNEKIINGVVTDNEIATSENRLATSSFIKVEPNTKYTVSFTTNAGINNINISYFEYANFPRTSESGWVSNFTFTTGSTINYVLLTFRNSSNNTINITNISKVQLEKGESASTYKEYQGLDTNKLKNKELIVGSIRSNNILGLQNGTYNNNGVTAIVNNGIITLSGTANGTSFIDVPLIKNINIEANFDYCLSCNNNFAIGDNVNTTWAGIRFYFNDSSTSDITSFYKKNNYTKYTFFTKTATKLTIRTASGLGYSSGSTIKPQFEKAETPTVFYPYQDLSSPDGSAKWLSNDILTINKGSLVNNRSYYTNNTIQFNIKLSGVSINANSGTTIITLPSSFAGTVETSLYAIASSYAPIICWFRTDGTIAISSNVALSNVEIRITGGLYKS